MGNRLVYVITFMKPNQGLLYAEDGSKIMVEEPMIQGIMKRRKTKW